MKKVLILANSDMGLYRFRRELIEKLNKEYELYISVPKGEYSEELERMGCHLYFSDIDRRGTNPVKEFLLVNYYRKLINYVSPDMVFTYTIKPNIYGGLACRLLKVPYAPNITGLGTAIENEGLFSRALWFLYKTSLKKANTVFFQNSQNKNIFEEKGIIGAKNILLPGSGVNLESNPYEEYPADNSKTILLFVGRIMKDKGVEELVNAARELKGKYENLHFQMVGPIEEDYLQEFQKLEANKYVELCGSQKDVHRYMKEAHAIVVPSYHEGMSNVCLEAASCGRPLLASKIPGCMEAFDEGVTGFGFEPRSTESLRQAIEKFVATTANQRAEMGKLGRKKMENEFDRNIIISKYLETLQNIS